MGIFLKNEKGGSFLQQKKDKPKYVCCVRENNESLCVFACAHVYVRMCERAHMCMYAYVKIFHRHLINT